MAFLRTCLIASKRHAAMLGDDTEAANGAADNADSSLLLLRTRNLTLAGDETL